MSIDKVRGSLDAMGVTPSRKLGQNFIVDESISQWVVDQLALAPMDTVVEIGPGTGSLTQHVVGKVEKLILIEFDARLAELLRTQYALEDSVTVIHEDAVRYDTRQLMAEGPIKLLSNLPFSAGGAIMRNFLERPSVVEKAVFILQKEVVERMLASPRSKEYGVLTLRVQAEWEVRPLKLLPPEVFHPRPIIESSVIALTPRRDPLPVYDDRLFDQLIRRGFAQRRKQVRKQMPEEPTWDVVCAELGISETARAEEVSLEQWVEMTRLYDDHPLKNVAQKDDEIFDVVDENDEVLRQERRDVVHQEDLLHRAVHIYIFNKRKEVFLQKRSRLKDKCPGMWGSSAAGHLDAGESYIACAVRELQEEAGISLEAYEMQKVTKLAPKEETGWEFIELYLVRHDGALRYPCSEVETGIWMGINEVSTWLEKRPQDFSPGFGECWRAFQSAMAGRQ